MSSFEGVVGNYGLTDRLIHRFAFAHPTIQRALSDVESDLFADELREVRTEAPVFITGLPRAGTTLLLEMLYATGDFFTFTYRQMPFVMAPLLWDRVSAPFQKAAVAAERAHGDGMEVSFDSPEAFEEVVWLNYLRSSYIGENSIRPLPSDAITLEFRHAFDQLLGKLQRLDARKRPDHHGRRYLSKNNMNIARLAALPALFADATILLCVRDPLTHASSLKAQHERFSALHHEDRFAKRYMAWIGHYDFGANFKPIDFAGATEPSSAARDPAFWLGYWVAAYRHVLQFLNDNTRIVAFEALVEPGSGTLDHLAHAIGIRSRELLLAQAPRLRHAGSAPLDEASLPRSLLREARAIYAELRALSL